MQITIFDFVVGLVGLISFVLYLFQLYKDRTNRRIADTELRLHETTLMAIWQTLSEGAHSLTQLEHKGADSTTIASNMSRVLESQRIHIAEMLHRYYGLKPQTQSSSSLPTSPLTLIQSEEAITTAMIEAVETAESYLFTVGGRSRNEPYLNAVKQRVMRGDIRYLRIITGDHIRHPLCVHIRELLEQRENIQFGYLKEDKYGGILVTNNKIIQALQSSRVSSLDKGLVLEDERVASDYRLYILELLSSAEPVTNMDLVEALCTTCRQKRSTVS